MSTTIHKQVMTEARKMLEKDWWAGPMRSPAMNVGKDYYCAVIALDRASTKLGFNLDNAALTHFEMTPEALADFNDTHTHAEVLQLFDKAIERT